MARAFLLVIGVFLLVTSCTQRSICPAFQSAYIYDKDALRKKFSYFQEDSTPKVLTASKTRYLVAEPTPYRKKIRSMQTVEMKPVPIHVPDSITSADSVSMHELDRAARSVIDSTFIQDVPRPEASLVEDSVYVITKDKELRLLKYNGADSLVYDPVTNRYIAQKPEYYVKDVRLNVQQDNYMWYLREYLVLPDVRLARIQQGAEKSRVAKEASTKKQEKKGLKGFFKNLFKKKPKEADTTELPPPTQEEFDFIDADTLTQVDPPVEDQGVRRGFFAPKKKSNHGDTSDVATAPDKKKKRPKSGDPLKEEEVPDENIQNGF
ncbi:MAG TPA: hypothetical protein VIQ51_11865 [Chryseosolibacter sp.]